MAYLRFSFNPLFPPEVIRHYLRTSSLFVSIGSFAIMDHCITNGYSNRCIIPVSIIGLSVLICPVAHALYVSIKGRNRRPVEEIQAEVEELKLMRYINEALEKYQPLRIHFYEMFGLSNLSEMETFYSAEINSLSEASDLQKFERPDYNETKRLYLEMFFEVHKAIVKYKHKKTTGGETELYKFVLDKIVLTILQNYMERINYIVSKCDGNPRIVVPTSLRNEIFYDRIEKAYLKLIVDDCLDNCGAQALELRDVLRTFKY